MFSAIMEAQQRKKEMKIIEYTITEKVEITDTLCVEDEGRATG